MLLEFDYFYFNKDRFKASDCRISYVRRDSSEFRITFRQTLFSKIKKKTFFIEKCFALKYRQFKMSHVKAGNSRPLSVVFNCVHFRIKVRKIYFIIKHKEIHFSTYLFSGYDKIKFWIDVKICR